MDKVLASLKRSIAAQARKYPQPNFRDYTIRRVGDRMKKTSLAGMTEAQKESLAADLRVELDQLKRMTVFAKNVGSPEDFKTVLQRSEASEEGDKKD